MEITLDPSHRPPLPLNGSPQEEIEEAFDAKNAALRLEDIFNRLLEILNRLSTKNKTEEKRLEKEYLRLTQEAAGLLKRGGYYQLAQTMVAIGSAGLAGAANAQAVQELIQSVGSLGSNSLIQAPQDVTRSQAALKQTKLNNLGANAGANQNIESAMRALFDTILRMVQEASRA